MKKTLSLLLTIAVGVFTGACSGKLSASKAEQLIKEKYFGSHDELTCTLASTVSEAPGGKYTAIVATPTCMKVLAELGHVTAASGTTFKPGPKASIDRVWLDFPCGRRTYGDITSITTDAGEKSATVKYTRTAKVDQAVMSKLSVCALRDPPTDGEAEREVKFAKDDSGTWRIK